MDNLTVHTNSIVGKKVIIIIGVKFTAVALELTKSGRPRCIHCVLTHAALST